jgi:predicted TIM-barrel fold metal-dependent hydrolase
MRNSWKSNFYLRGAGLAEEELQEHGDRISILKIAELVGQSDLVDGAVVLALDAVIDEAGDVDASRTIFAIPNEFVAKEIEHYDHLYFGASVNPYRPDALDRLEWCRHKGAKLVKWLPSIQFIDPSDRRIEPFYRKLIELGLPLLSHAGDERCFSDAVNGFSDPFRLRFPLQLGVKVVAAHMGSTGRNEGQDNMERTVGLMDEFPNLWGDLSALTQINRKRFLKKALEIPRLHDRILYGSDFPLMNMALVSPYYFPLSLTWKQMRRIAGIENPWDRDVALKQALGVPDKVFQNSARFLGIY